MKNLLPLLLITFLSLPVLSQDKNPQKEIGLQFNDFDKFGVAFMFGSPESLWRIDALILKVNELENEYNNADENITEFGYSISFGREYRQLVSPTIKLKYGVSALFGYNLNKKFSESNQSDRPDRKDKKVKYEPGISLLLGIDYQLSESFSIGVEILPSFQYIIGKSTVTIYNGYQYKEKFNISGYEYGLNSSQAMLTLSYKITSPSSK